VDVEDCTICDKTIMVSLLISRGEQSHDVTVRVISTASMIARHVSSAVAILDGLLGKEARVWKNISS
jgi:hypothetical protein